MQKIRIETLFTINARETILLDDELQITFIRHSHKDVTAQMEASPLLISMAYKNLFTNDEATKTYRLEDKAPYM